LPLHPKPHVDVIAAGVHGGIRAAGLTAKILDGRKVLDFSTCVNPYRHLRNLSKAAHAADIHEYPDPNSSALIEALSEKLELPSACLIAGNGSTELIRLAAMAYFGKGDTVIIPRPTYGEYELACILVNAVVENHKLLEKDDYRLDIDSLITFAGKRHPRGIFICNPNNPTGQHLQFGDIQKIVIAFPDTLIILDEAYSAFANDPWPSQNLLLSKNVLIIRSMTKDYALAGLRLGYGMASPEIAAALRKVRPPWNISAIAQSVGNAVLRDTDLMIQSVSKIRRSRDYLIRSLVELGYTVLPTSANFFVFRVGDAGDFRDRLLKKGFLVRDCASFGMPEYIRLAPRNWPECRQLIRAIAEMKGTK
jgi:histidinol-phosphate aminotransferase